MKFRKLRIAWSVACGIACVLLCVLWVRSYKRGDIVQAPVSATRGIGFTSLHGWVKLSTFRTNGKDCWLLRSFPGDEAMQMYGEFFEAKQNHWKFGTHVISGTYAIMMPHWFILLIAPLTATPWIKWRFNVRTLLITTTLVAVVLGLIVWSVR
jgi:hypothetical protein